jgi:hypothetical protein
MPTRSALLLLGVLLVAHTAAAAEEPAPAAAIPAPGVATAPPAAAGLRDTEERSIPEGRVLNGHVFIPSAAVPGALTTTSFSSYLVLGVGKTSGSTQIGDKLYSGDFDYAGVGAILGYEYAFLRYFSVRFTLNEIVYSGINGSSAIVVGTALSTGGALGVTASMPVGDSLRLGVLFDAGIAPGLALTIGNGIRTIIENCKAGNCNIGNENGLFGMNNATTIQPALAANWAPSRAFGLTGNVAYLHVSQDRNNGTFNGDAVTLATAADFDFLAISNAPIGLQLAFSYTAPIGGTGLQHVTDLGGGIFYTGRPHLALGLQLVSRRFAVQPTVDVSWSTFISTLGMRYYW